MASNRDVVGIGIVGAGNIADMNVAGYLDDPRCQVVAVCDPRESQAAGAAARWGGPTVYTDLDDLLADPAVDAVEILTPTNLHREHVLAALAAGKHVSCQKPLANSVTDGRIMEAAAEEAGLILRVSECFRHYPPLELAKQLIAEGAIGKPTNLRTRTVVGQTESPFQNGLDMEGYMWRMTAASPGGHLFDDMIHKYAVALWMLDQDIVSVQATVRRRDYYFEPLAAIFEYEDPEVLGTMEVSYAPKMWLRSAYYGADEFWEVQGDEGFLWVTRCTGQLLDQPAVVLYDGAKGKETTTSFPGVDDDWGTGFRRASTHFIDALVDGVPAEMSAGEAIKALQLCFAVYQAGNTHLPVDPRIIDHLVVPDGVADMKVTRTLHHSVNVEGDLSPTIEFYERLLELPSDDRPEIPGVGGHWFSAGNAQLHLVDADAGPDGIQPTGPHVCFAVDDLDGAIAQLEAEGIPYLSGAQGTTIQIWFVDPAGNTVEIQQDPDVTPSV